ncbi:MAG: FecR family protein [Planctomycetota bacterium]
MNEWDDLVDRHLVGDLSESEMERLAELLDGDPSLRKDFVERSSWETELAGVLRTGGDDETGKFDSSSIGTLETRQGRSIRFLSAMLAIATVTILMLSALLLSSRKNLTGDSSQEQAAKPESIAQITGLSGALIWTGDRGETVQNISVGTELAGGTIEGLAPDSWFELQFRDGSTVMISGNSLLTFADLGQKKLRLREGRLSASVEPQPDGKPMLIHTRSAVLKVLGTQFDVEADLASTVLTVSEGKVNFMRLSDGSEVDVPAKHHVTTDTDDDLAPALVQNSVSAWKSQLHLRRGSYGKWLPATSQQEAAQKAIPLVPPDNPNATLYLLGIPVPRSDGPPVVVRSEAQFIVRGRLDKPARVYFGIAVSDASGEFAGKFRGDLGGQQPISEPDENGQFEVVYRIGDFTLDPCVRDREKELAVRPDELVLNNVWAFTHSGGPSGLEVTAVELISPEHNSQLEK